MWDIQNFGIFLTTAIMLNLYPGKETFYILGRSIEQGRDMGMASALGISTGTLIQTLIATLVIAAVMAVSAPAFWILKLIGAVCLVLLGGKLIFSRFSPVFVSISPEKEHFSSVYRQDVIAKLLNPKVACFYLVFIPQFIRSSSPDKFSAFVALGLCYTLISVLWSMGLACYPHLLGYRVSKNMTFAAMLNRIGGSVLFIQGVRLAVSR